MTRRKRWPNNAEWARQDALALAAEIDLLARPILLNEAMSEVERVQRAGEICHKAQQIVLRLREAREGGQ